MLIEQENSDQHEVATCMSQICFLNVNLPLNKDAFYINKETLLPVQPYNDMYAPEMRIPGHFIRSPRVSILMKARVVSNPLIPPKLGSTLKIYFRSCSRLKIINFLVICS